MLICYMLYVKYINTVNTRFIDWLVDWLIPCKQAARPPSDDLK